MWVLLVRIGLNIVKVHSISVKFKGFLYIEKFYLGITLHIYKEPQQTWFLVLVSRGACNRKFTGIMNNKNNNKVLLNGYLEPLRPLGSGATGIVFLARSIQQEDELSEESVHTRPDCPPCWASLVAVKAFRRSRKSDLRQSENEEGILGRVPPHPFLPRLHAAFNFDDFRFLALEFCAGGDLHELRKSLPDKRFSPSAIRSSFLSLSLSYCGES